MRAVVEALAEHGMDAVEVEDDGVITVEVPCGEDGTYDCHEVIARVESWLNETGLPFVPEDGGDRVYIRPPAN